jgi:release factor glutamine methyltransferase
MIKERPPEDYEPRIGIKRGAFKGDMESNPETSFEETYEIAEDTLLLLKAAMEEARQDDRAIEIGCGRCLISRMLVTLVHSLLVTDINPHAAALAKCYGLNSVRADLFNGLKGQFDLIVFNPPYLPTAKEERQAGWINYAFDGGECGRDTIIRFIEDLKDHIAPEGRCLLLVSSLCGLDEVLKRIQMEGFEADLVANERYFFERLYVLRLRRAEGYDTLKQF